MPNIELIQGDCMDYLKSCNDKQFELAIVDPPYGIGISKNPVRQMHDKKNWDNKVPTIKYFEELFRVTKNTIIWGGNYFGLPATQNYIIWDKVQPFNFSLAMAELAWCSIQMPIKIFKQSVMVDRNKIHPTQKPYELYRWLLTNYAKQGDTILDTHGGSRSLAIACYDLGFDHVSIELDEDYHRESKARFDAHVAKYAPASEISVTTKGELKLF